MILGYKKQHLPLYSALQAGTYGPKPIWGRFGPGKAWNTGRWTS